MRFVMITTIAALAATSACGSSPGHASGAARKNSPHTAATTPAAATANIPGFSGPVEAASGDVSHVYGRCLNSWYTKAGSGITVHVGYPGPAMISVDVTLTDGSESPPEAHQQFTMAQGKRVRSLHFPAIQHAGFPQITVGSGRDVKICDAPQR